MPKDKPDKPHDPVAKRGAQPYLVPSNSTQPHSDTNAPEPNTPTKSTSAVNPLVTADDVPECSKDRLIGRLEGLAALESDYTRSNLLANIVSDLKGKFPAIERDIGKLETYTAMEMNPGKKKIVEGIIKTMERKKGKW